MSNGQQTELPGTPERSELGKKAVEYLGEKDRFSAQKLELDRVKLELIELFIKEGTTSIKVAGHVVSYAHMEADRITAKEAL